MTDYLEIFRQFDKPYERFDNSMLGPGFAAELDTVSRFWFACGYRPGIANDLFETLRGFEVYRSGQTVRDDRRLECDY